MKYIKFLKNATLFVAIVLLNSVSFFGHSSAISSTAHHTGNTAKHGSVNSSACATLCRTAIIEKQDYIVSNKEEEDDDNFTKPYYALDQVLRDDSESMAQRLYAEIIKPPPKVSIYILYGVFRT